MVGEFGWPLLLDGQPAKSLALARSSGVTVESERRFLEWAGRAVPDEQAKTYSAGQLAAPEQLPVGVIDQLHRVRAARCPRRALRLSRSHRGAATRRAGRLGRRAVDHHAKPARDPQVASRRGALQPAPLSRTASDAILVEQLKGRTDKTGQFVLPVDDGGRERSDGLFEQAQAAEEAGDFETAERLYRQVQPARSARPGGGVQSRQPAARAAAARSKPKPRIAPPPRRTGVRRGLVQSRRSARRAGRSRGSDRRRSSTRLRPTRIMPTRSSISACSISAPTMCRGGCAILAALPGAGRAVPLGLARPAGVEILRNEDRSILIDHGRAHRGGAKRPRRRASSATRSRRTRKSATSAALPSRSRSAGKAKAGPRLAIRRAAPRCAARALRPAARTRRHAEELGGDARPEPRRDGKAARGAHRRSPDAVSRLRGQHPEGRVRRRRDDRVGPRPLGAGVRSRMGPRQGPSRIRAAWRAAARPLAPRADEAAARREEGELAADQGRG